MFPGEILKLNPAFKPPTDYKPLLKEEKVTIPVSVNLYSALLPLLHSKPSTGPKVLTCMYLVIVINASLSYMY